MKVREGTVTWNAHVFVPDAVFERQQLSTRVKHIADVMLDTDGADPESLPDSNGFDFGKMGSLRGYWDFWDRLHADETDSCFSYAPLFMAVQSSLSFDRSFRREFDDLADTKVTPRVLYYPFGAIVVRLRLYFEFSDPVSVDRFVDFKRSASSSLSFGYRSGVEYSRRDTPLLALKLRTLEWLFDGDPPDRLYGAAGDEKTYDVTYLYNELDPTNEGLAKLLSTDSRALSEYFVERKTRPSFGKLSQDEFIVKSDGAVLYTPEFLDVSPNRRRWKRIQVLNNVYLAVDLGLYERYGVSKLQNAFRELLESLNRGTVAGNVTDAKSLAMASESHRLGDSLSGLRRRAYEELQPDNQTEQREAISEFVSRVVEQDSDLREALRNIGPGFF